MRKFAIKSLLRVCKSSNKVYALVCDLVPSVFDSVLVTVVPTNEYDAIEKKLLLSATIIQLSVSKDLRADFLDKYLDCFASDIFSKHDTNNLVYLFENAVAGLSFGNSSSETERRKMVMDELLSYLRHRLVDYRVFINEYFEGRFENLEGFFYLLSCKPFDTANWHLAPYSNYLRNDIEYIGYNSGTFDRFKETLIPLKEFYNLVKIPLYTWMTNDPAKETFHTEGLLGTLKITKGLRYLKFNSLSGVGVISCKHCSFSKNIVSFVHGAMSASIGRQCPQCGEFCVENNESEEYHTFGPSTQNFECPKCKYIIRYKDESIFKGNENPIFCPHCHSVDLQYNTSIIT